MSASDSSPDGAADLSPPVYRCHCTVCGRRWRTQHPRPQRRDADLATCAPQVTCNGSSTCVRLLVNEPCPPKSAGTHSAASAADRALRQPHRPDPTPGGLARRDGGSRLASGAARAEDV